MANPLDELQKLGQPQPQAGPAAPTGGAFGDFAKLGDPQAQAGPAGGAGTFSALGAPTASGGGAQAPAQLKPPTTGGPAGVATPGATGATPAAAPNPMDPNAVWGNLTNQFQTKFGRAMTGDEAKALQQYAGYTGGAITQSMVDKATQGIGAYTGDLSNPFGPAAPGVGATPAQTPNQQTNDLAQSELQKLLTTGSTDAMQLDMNNPAIAAQRAQFDRINNRNATRDTMAAAESAAASGGLGSGGFDAAKAGAQQGREDRAANFESQLMTQELQGQRDRVMKAMEMAVATGDQAQQRALQDKLAQLDINLRGQLGRGQLGLGLLGTMLQDKQAGDRLGLGYAQLGQQANQGILDAILRGF